MVNASERFAQAFSLTWQRIPVRDQETINRFLAQCPGFVHLCFAMDFQALPEEPWGRCGPHGNNMVFTFLAAFVETADHKPGVLESVIAHELAHCLNHATGAWDPDAVREEANVSQVMARWGFPEPGRLPLEWKRTIEQWKQRHQVEFGDQTERRLFVEAPEL
jgi:hypothetical protein